MTHPWKCVQGHENRTEVPAEAQQGRHRFLALRCSAPGCDERTSILVGVSKALPNERPERRRRPGAERK
jgi:hypothetical protein